jgi:hypothetical protein
MSLSSLIASRNPGAMPWRVGFELGHFCGVQECRETPGAYSQFCVKHQSYVARAAARDELPAKAVR